MDKYEYIIQLGKELPLIDEKYKTPDNLIKGCQSQVWLYAQKEGEKLLFYADSNTAITKGIISLLVRVLSGRTPEAVLKADLGFIEQIGLRSLLSSQRSNGLNAMIQKMKWYAEVFQQEVR